MDPYPIISHLSYVGIFLVVSFLGYVAPVPEEVLLPTIGYLVYLGIYDFWYAVISALAGIGLSDNILYWLSRIKGQKYIDRFAARFRISDWQIQRAKKAIHRNATFGLSVIRMIPGIKLLGPILAGLSGMHWRHFQLFDLLGASAWVISLMALGFYFGSKMHSAFGTIRELIPIVFLLALFAAAAYVFRNKKKITDAAFDGRA